MIYDSIKKLIKYALQCGLIEVEDSVYVTNRILEALSLDKYIDSSEDFDEISLEEVLGDIFDYACENKLIEDITVCRDLFDTKIMGCLTPFPHDVVKKFNDLYLHSPKIAHIGIIV